MNLPSKQQLPCKLQHKLLGNCTLVRVEGVHWVVSFGSMELRVSPSQFSAYQILEPEPVPGRVDVELTTPVIPQSQPTGPPVQPALEPVAHKAFDLDRHEQSEPRPLQLPQLAVPSEADSPLSPQVVRSQLRRAIRSLSTGLSPEDPNLTLSLSVGLKKPFEHLDHFYKKVSDGGAAMVVRGAYGDGKTLMLQSAKAKGLANNFVCSETEIDSSEVRLDQAPTVYATLMRSLRFPDGGQGLDHLLELFEQWLESKQAPCGPSQLFRWLDSQIGCSYLAWMLTARNLRHSRDLLEALKGAPIPLARLRAAHPLPKEPGRWQYFKFGTQGDVGSYLICGVSRLVTLLGFSGLIMGLDEMEKWQDLDWKNQERASNLLGGLIWGAVEPEGRRHCTFRANSSWANKWTCLHSSLMTHSGFNGGCPFTTLSRCNLGILIAMTPRGEESPENVWQDYGNLEIIDLPRYTLASFCEHFSKIAAIFEQAYEIEVPTDKLLKAAESIWRRSSDRSARSGSLAITEILENWRRKND